MTPWDIKILNLRPSSNILVQKKKNFFLDFVSHFALSDSVFEIQLPEKFTIFWNFFRRHLYEELSEISGLFYWLVRRHS